MDLQTGEAITFGEDAAFSATSINKIAILARLYATLPTPPTENVATDIANTMICSDNAATNRLLSIIGGGDEYQGADEVTRFTRSLGIDVGSSVIIDELGPDTLMAELRKVWDESQPHIEVATLLDWFASYVYLPRLRDNATLAMAIEKVIEKIEAPVAFAQAYDEQAGQYQGVSLWSSGLGTNIASGLLVRRRRAAAARLAWRSLATARSISARGMRPSIWRPSGNCPRFSCARTTSMANIRALGRPRRWSMWPTARRLMASPAR